MTARRLRLAAAAALAALPVHAAGPLGSLTAYLDGQRMDWHLIEIEQGGRATASASFRQTAYGATLILHGHTETRFTSRGGLSVEVRYHGLFDAAATPAGLDILYLPEGLRGPIWTSADAPRPPAIEILSFDLWGDVGHVEAVVTAQLCLRRTLYDKTDPTTCKTLSGHVSTDLAAE